MQVIYQGLKIRLPIDGIIQVEDLTLEASFNRHATVCMLLLMEEEGIERSIHELEDGAGVEIDEGDGPGKRALLSEDNSGFLYK